ncbi:MAG: 50S ribosomal protein L9 [Candidatus Aquicultor primus]|uniref:Large ribosomal subunit protein bL9 n=1 Tax=Candidatus Aquicultor primus TaxID=1797195 RepID=A0A1F2UP69_9ACTN|nr:MAG: 50S ribosomal protein L9 [Candidatus Aquicultor primus]HCH00084.1 50S ribosomal protein L9 [Actinomycetota bacterium]
MKVILKETVGGLGRIGEVVEVARGYAQNYLVPRGMAVVATPGTLKDWEHKKATTSKRQAHELSEAQELADSIKDKEVTVEAKAGEGGKLYGSITAKEVAEAITKQLKIEVDRKKVDIAGAIKELGSHPVSVKVYPGVDAIVSINVVAAKEE